MTPLGERLARLIARGGPIPVSEYMAACLFDPEHGYYTTREPFGARGDFVTAPEVSQMFGEIVAAWLYGAWCALGAPRPARLVEIGPGRGTMMADMLRTLARLDASLVDGLSIEMVETSPRLRRLQRERLAGRRFAIEWTDEVRAVEVPTLLVANELFDAVPTRQFVKSGNGWVERMVGLSDDGALRFEEGVAGLDPTRLPPGAGSAPHGSIFELAPAREAMMERLVETVGARGAMLLIDYGHRGPALGDTLQALSSHRFQDVLEAPGEADLTSHVDFSPLAEIAAAEGLSTAFATQGEFLVANGLLARAGTLGSGRDAATQDAIRAAVERLAGPEAMGHLFKVLAVGPRAAALPPLR